MTSPDNQENPADFSPTVEEDSLVITLPDDSNAPKDLWLWAGVLVILTLVAYWPATGGLFVWKDDKHVAENTLLAQPGGLGTIWLQRWQDTKQYPLPEYHPVAFTSYWLDYRLGGHNVQNLPTPFVYHVTNLLLHAAAAAFVWLVLRKLKVPGAWLAAAVFALHPINTEAVAWISQRASVMAGLLFFASIYTYLLFVEEDEKARAGEVVDPVREWGLYAGSLVLFVLAMLSKSPAFAMPFVVGLALWWQRRFAARHLMLLAPFAIIGVVLAFNAVDFERDNGGAVGPGFEFSIAQRFIVAGRAVWFYIGKLLLPMQLSFLYPQWSIESEGATAFLPLAGIVAVLVLLLAGVKCIGRGFIVAILAFVLCLLPALGLFNIAPMRFTFIADHYAYLASMPLIALVIGAVATAVQRMRRQPGSQVGLAVGLSALVLIGLGSATWVRAHVFADSLSLWRDAALKNPGSYFAHDRYATELGARSELDLAEGDADHAVQDATDAMHEASVASEINPQDAEAEWIAGRLLVRQKDLEGAVHRLSRATNLDPNLNEAWQDLAATLIALKQYDEAIEKLNISLRVQSQSSLTHQLLAAAYLGLGNPERAMAEDREALRINPNNFRAREELGDLLATAGRDKEAKLEFTQILEAQPTRAELWDKVGVLTAKQGDMRSAVVFFNTALKLNPDDPEAKQHLAMAVGALEKQRMSATTRSATQPATAPTSAP